MFTVTNLAVYHYTANNPLKYIDPDGRDHHSHIYLTIIRHKDSPMSRRDSSFGQLDFARLTNSETGQTFHLFGMQTVSNHSKYPEGNTVAAFMGGFRLQYLGEGEDVTFFNGTSSQFAGPVFNVVSALTEGGESTNNWGSLIGNPNPSPIRMHSDEFWETGEAAAMRSGGCFMYCSSYAERFEEQLADWGVEPGDTFDGHIIQTWDQ